MSDAKMSERDEHVLDRSPPIPELVGGDPVFDIMILGRSGAGKTVLLSSFYKFFSIQNKDSRYRVVCMNNENNKPPTGTSPETILNRTFQTLVKLDGPWPPGTPDVNEFVFKFLCEQGGKSFSLFRIRMHDYPGGFVAKRSGEIAEFMEKRSASAHALLVLLDGKKIFNHLEQRHSGVQDSFDNDLTLLMPIVQRCIGRPIHFVITKSDLLDKERHPLSKIRQILMDHPSFSNIVQQQRGAKVPCYLVPVSAVGGAFAQFDPIKGVVIKRPDGKVRPFNTQTCFNMALADQVKAFASLSKAGATVPDTLKARLKIARVGVFFAGLVKEWAPYVGAIFGPLTISVLSGIVSRAQRHLEQMHSDTDAHIKSIMANVSNNAEAFEAVLEVQIISIAKFLNAFPYADLNNEEQDAVS